MSKGRKEPRKKMGGLVTRTARARAWRLKMEKSARERKEREKIKTERVAGILKENRPRKELEEIEQEIDSKERMSRKEREEKARKEEEENARKEEAQKESSCRSARERKQEENLRKEPLRAAGAILPQKKKSGKCVLLDNGMVSRSDGSLLCALCDDQSSQPKEPDHAKLESHATRLAIFEIRFENRRLDVLCKTCNLIIRPDVVKTHARHHRIMPWHEPNDLYETLYKHRIAHCSDTFYCYPCEVILSDWFDAHSHASRSSHRKLWKTRSVPPDARVAVNGIPKLSARNAIFASDSNLECKICRCRISPSASHVAEHVAGSRHAAALLEFSKFLKDAGRSNVMKKNAIRMCPDGEYRCVPCACSFENFDQVAAHVTEKSHATHREKNVLGGARPSEHENSSPDDVTVQRSSESADRTIGSAVADTLPNDDVIATKIIEKRAAKIGNEEKTKVRRVSSVLSRDYVLRTTSSSNCKLCDCSILDVNQHVTGNNHAAALRRHRCDLIDVLTPNAREYHCNACDCRIPGVDNLWRHTRGSRHVASVASLDKKSAVDDEQESALVYRSRNAKSQTSEPKYTTRSSSFNEKTNCDACGAKFPNDLALHAHMAGHYSLQFMNAAAVAMNGFSNGAVVRLVNEGPTVRDEDGDSTSSDDREEGPDERPMRRASPKGRKPINAAKWRKIVAILSSENDEIYAMRDKLREFELATRLSYESPGDNGRIYCLVCVRLTEFTADDYLEHMTSLNHSVWLEGMEREHALFESHPEQFSAVDLGVESMEVRAGRVYCHPCDRFIDDLDDDLRAHIGAKGHAKAREPVRERQAARFDLLARSYACDWYGVQLYRCVPCLATFRHEVNFTEHLASNDHALIAKLSPRASRRLVFDFCATCALLWYGYRRTYAYHRLIGSHCLLERDGHYKPARLTDETRQLLREPRLCVDEFVERCEKNGERERDREATIVRDIETAVRKIFPEAEAHLFGSRVTGLGSLGCDIDVFLDCGNTYSGSKSSRGEMLKLIGPVAARLKNSSDCWVIEELLTACRSPIIKAHHRGTELDCDVSFENGLAVENTKLIRSYNECFPLCRQMIIFLKRWATLCDLTGTRRITSYALYWHVIFYLQQEEILPSVAELIAKQNASRKIDGWEVGVSRDFTVNETSAVRSLDELLNGFFLYWSTFDHRRDVACPLIGRALKKLCFVNCDEMPAAMRPYVDYLNKSTNGASPEPFRIDSEMCIQDPFDLQHNLTKAVRKVCLKRFRQYCALSYGVRS